MARLLVMLTIALALGLGKADAQGFFNLTADEVRIDSVLPSFGHSFPLTEGWADSTYSVTIEYPEFIDMGEADVARLHAIGCDTLPPLPAVSAAVGVSRKRASLDVSFVPLVFRDGKWQKLVSFKLAVKAAPSPTASAKTTTAGASTRATAASSRYADNSVLSSGTWVKIRVSESGVHQITDELAKQAGFSSASDVRVYGYGGARQPESLDGDYLSSTDDLQQVAQCVVDGRRLFYAQGPVSWENGSTRVRNPYSDYGYYFLTDSGEDVITADSADFVDSFYPAGEDYNVLYEVDDYAWFSGGRNLYDSRTFTIGSPMTYLLTTESPGTTGRLTVSLTADALSYATVAMNGVTLGTITISGSGTYDYAKSNSGSFTVSNVGATDTVSITQTSGGTMRLDYIALHTNEPKAAPRLSSETFPVPEYVYRITNQNLHSHGATDMVIIIPTSQNLLEQAERIAQLHEETDSMRVRIVPADEIFNEFSSGTPDATAYRRYMKMLYDRAETEADMPSHLLLFGDGAWDNRMRLSDWSGYSPDDFLLCFESEQSLSDLECYVSDDYFCLLDDGETIATTTGSSTTYTGKPDVAVGRFPVRTADEAKIIVDKTLAYANNEHAGAWQNTLVFMGDDGNNNIHMETADSVANLVKRLYPSYSVKKIMWDAYERVTSATGNTYPDASTLVRQYMSEGALMMNYSGHGATYRMSHERVVELSDFQSISTDNLPFWLTASCDIMPFDGQTTNIGESAMLNSSGGAVAFLGTTRTVYSNYNESMNLAFTEEVLSTEGGGVTLGEALRRAKVYLVESSKDRTYNKLHYALLGDPALKLACPRLNAIVDSINGLAVADGTMLTLPAGSVATVKGHIEGDGGLPVTAFNGTLTATVSDAEQEIECRLNDTSSDGASVAFVYRDRTSTVYKGTNNVADGEFSFTFAVPKDISYSDNTALITLYAVSDDLSLTANGSNEGLVLNGTGDLGLDSIGPSIYCYLNSTSFTNGDCVNATPYFFAELTDEDGINASGGGIGHDLQLSIDGDPSQTYTLNDYFTFDFGSYTTGTVGYSIPTLTDGYHTLRFRAWDVLNNSSTSELSFYVSSAAQPTLFDVICTKNPATTSTSFRIIHDRIGSDMDVRLEVFDMSGRTLWVYEESGVPSDNTYTIDWDLTIDGGRPLGTGVYLYRVGVSSSGSEYTTKAKKLIVIRQ